MERDPMSSGRDLGGPIVAVAEDGSCVVQRGAHVDVYRPDLEEPARIAIGDGTGTPGTFYAVSPAAMRVARVDRSGWVELWDAGARRPIARLDPGKALGATFEAHLVGPGPETLSSWGAPVFLDADTLVTHHGAGVVVWDVPSGSARCALSEPSIQIARETFSLGQDRAAVRSSSNSPGVHNALLVELSLRECRVVARHLALPARDLAKAARRGRETFIFTSRGLRISGPERTEHVPLLDGEYATAMHVAEDARSVAWGSSGGSVSVWDRGTNRLACVVGARPERTVVHLRQQRGHVVAYAADGRVATLPIPASDDGRGVEPALVDLDRLAWEEALVLVGLGAAPAAAERMERLRTAGPPRYRFVAEYVGSLADEEDPEAFRERMARSGLSYLGEDSTLSAAEDFSSAEILWPAVDLLLSWLDGVRPGEAPERGLEIGREIALQLSEADEGRAHAVVLRRLVAAYPDSSELREDLESLEDMDE